MTHPLALFLLIFALAPLGGCGHGLFARRVASIDPASYLAALTPSPDRVGLSAEADLEYTGSGRRFDVQIFLLTAGEGRFRVEVPGPLGTTAFVLVADGANLWAYRPGEGTACRGALGEEAATGGWPFPLPVDPSRFPAILVRTLPSGVDPSLAQAFDMANGRIELVLPVGSGQARYLFLPGADPILNHAEWTGPNGTVSVDFSAQPPGLPTQFSSRWKKGRLRGTLDSAKFLPEVPNLAFDPPFPPGTEIKELEEAP